MGLTDKPVCSFDMIEVQLRLFDLYQSDQLTEFCTYFWYFCDVDVYMANWGRVEFHQIMLKKDLLSNK